MILLVGATRAELQACGQLPFRSTCHLFPGFDADLWCGPDGQEVAAVCVGVGKVHAAIHTCRAIQLLEPHLVACMGTCGGIDPSLEVGDMLLASRVVQYDVDLRRFGLPVGHLPSFGTEVSGFLDTGVPRGNAGLPADLLVGKTLGSADRFHVSGSDSVFPWMQELGIDAVDMESYAVVASARLYGIPSCIIRTVSDAPGKRLPARYGEFLRNASKRMLDVVLAVCSEHPQTVPSEKSPMIL